MRVVSCGSGSGASPPGDDLANTLDPTRGLQSLIIEGNGEGEDACPEQDCCRHR